MRGLELPAQLVMIYLLLHLRFVGLVFSSPIFTATVAPTPFRYLFAVMLTVCSVGVIKPESFPLIYFDEVLRNKLLETFFDCLNPNGLLFIGESECFTFPKNTFELLNTQGSYAYRKPESR